MEPHLTFAAMTWNILADGYAPHAMFQHMPANKLAWGVRGPRIISQIVSSAPDIVALQEVQSSSHGWGRLVKPDSIDHAHWMYTQLGKAGYEGAYAVRENSIMSWKKEFDLKSNDPSKRNFSWNCGGSPGARIGLALFYKREVWSEIAGTTISMSSHFRNLGLADEPRRALQGWYNAQLLVLRHKATGALIAVINTHLPVPSDTLPNTGAAQQIQYVHAIVSEAASRLVQFKQDMPVLFMGDLNAKPTSATYKLLSTGMLPAEEPAAVMPAAKKGKVVTGASDASGAVAIPEPEPTLPMPHMPPTLGRPFTSAYFAVNGSEPVFTTYAAKYPYVKPAAPAPVFSAGEESTSSVPAENTPALPESLFIDCLDYIFYRNGSGMGAEWTLQPKGVIPTPTEDQVKPHVAMPNEAEHPSDHCPIMATFELRCSFDQCS